MIKKGKEMQLIGCVLPSPYSVRKFLIVMALCGGRGVKLFL